MGTIRVALIRTHFRGRIILLLTTHEPPSIVEQMGFELHDGSNLAGNCWFVQGLSGQVGIRNFLETPTALNQGMFFALGPHYGLRDTPVWFEGSLVKGGGSPELLPRNIPGTIIFHNMRAPRI